MVFERRAAGVGQAPAARGEGLEQRHLQRVEVDPPARPWPRLHQARQDRARDDRRRHRQEAVDAQVLDRQADAATELGSAGRRARRPLRRGEARSSRGARGEGRLAVTHRGAPDQVKRPLGQADAHVGDAGRSQPRAHAGSLQLARDAREVGGDASRRAGARGGCAAVRPAEGRRGARPGVGISTARSSRRAMPASGQAASESRVRPSPGASENGGPASGSTTSPGGAPIDRGARLGTSSGESKGPMRSTRFYLRDGGRGGFTCAAGAAAAARP